MAYVLRWKIVQIDLAHAAGWKLDLDRPVQPNSTSLLRLQAEHSLGLIVNENGNHWTAVRWEHGAHWLLDSLKPAPMHMTQQETVAYLLQHRNAFLVVDRAGEQGNQPA